MHILDVLENALEAGATEVGLAIEEDQQADSLTIVVRDNGRGMDPIMARRALDPFFTTRTTRHVGLGLPLLAAAAERCEGGLTLESKPGHGTSVKVWFRRSHLDRAPLGNMADTLLAFVLGANDRVRLEYRHRVDRREFELDTAAIQAELGKIPFWYPAVRNWMHDYIAEGEAEVTAPAAG